MHLGATLGVGGLDYMKLGWREREIEYTTPKYASFMLIILN